MEQYLIDDAVARALAEDIGPGDITTAATVAAGTLGRALLLAKAPGVICGLGPATAAFRTVDPSIHFVPKLRDGDIVAGNRDVIAEIDGPAAGILTAERVALNFLQRMSGIATLTKKYVDAIAGTNAVIIDTRKTSPGLRAFEKYAVVVGGGRNHRFGLSDGVLIKDNHIEAAGGIRAAVDRARNVVPHLLKIEVEVKHRAQVAEALDAGADVILLDNMDMATLNTAVAQIGSRALTEASGGVSLDSVKAIAEVGVNFISVGAITHSAPALDISLDLELCQ